MTAIGRLQLAFFFAFLLGLPSTGGPNADNGKADARREQKFLRTTVPEFQVHDQSLIDSVWALARGPVPFGFGFEKPLKERLSDSDAPSPLLSLQLENKTMQEILDALCQADSRYTWSIDGPTINFVPLAVSNDSSYLLNRRLPRFELKNATDVQNGLLAIVRELPPPVEQIAQAQAGGADPYPAEPWTVTYEDLTVRQVVNRLATHGGPCAVWIFGGARDFRAFGFFNTFLCKQAPVARQTDSVATPK